MIKKDLMIEASITSSTMAKMGKEQAVSLVVLGRICKALCCNIDDILEIKY
jgi:DNA-binding Xre family transcriptional regulator